MEQLTLISRKSKVISMSRRTDPVWFPEKFSNILTKKYPPEVVHTVVVWTKFPEAVLKDPLFSVLSLYDQIYLHLTITGFGGTAIEPNVPHYQETLAFIPQLIDFVKDPSRIRIRPDPLLRFSREERTYSNFKKAKEIIQESFRHGISCFSTSFCTHYEKVKKRFAEKGYKLLDFDRTEEIIRDLQDLARENKSVVLTCCVPGFSPTKCIDGELLNKLHPLNETCTTEKAPEQRAQCGCTKSIDIGWYDMICKSGCLYCYANTT